MAADVLSLWDGEKRGRGKDRTPPTEPPPGTPTLDWDAAPFRALGKSGKSWWFIDKSGEIVEYAHSALGQWPTLLAVCGGDDRWLVQHFPAFDRDGAPTGGFSPRRACGAIMQHATALPLFDPTQPRRRYGLWTVPTGYVLHLGRDLIWCGERRRAGRSEAGALWPALGERAAPAPPASAAIGREMEAHLRCWNFVEPALTDGSPCPPGSATAVLLGIIAAGMLGAALPWRPHGLVIGELGTGKTTLLRDVAAQLSPLTRYLNDYTEAGLRQLLNESAATVILDEAEGAAHAARIEKVIALLRLASSGSGAQSVKGGADHVPHTFSVSCSALLGAIFPPPLAPQDVSRITVLELLPLSPGVDVAPVLAFVEKHRLAIWGRVIAGVERALAVFTALRRRLLQRGFPARLADQLGAIAASRWIVVSDDDAVLDDPETVDEPLAVVGFLLTSDGERQADSGPARCLERLLTSPLDMAGDRLTVGQALARLRAIAGTSARGVEDTDAWQRAIKDAEQARALLGAHGLHFGSYPLRPPPDAPAPPLGLYVAAGAHPQLLRIFRDTDWGANAWATALKRLPEARSGREVAALWIGKVKQRAVFIPDSSLEAMM